MNLFHVFAVISGLVLFGCVSVGEQAPPQSGDGSFTPEIGFSYYFAYGSNMNRAQMDSRCPENRFIGKAILEGYELVYDGVPGNAYANIVENGNETVWGGLYAISANDETLLDGFEGVASGAYAKKDVSVTLDNGTIVAAMAYYRTGLAPAQPSQEYRNRVLQGARDCGLPEDYILGHLLNNSA